VSERLDAASGEAVLRFVAERTSDVYWTADDSGIIRYISPQVHELLGRLPEDIVGLPASALVHSDDVAEVASLQQTVLGRRDKCTLTYRLERTVGDPVWVEAIVHRRMSPDGAGAGVVGIWRDVTERRRVEEAFEHQAYHDVLTDLPNRRLFEDRLTIALAQARRSGAQLAVFLINIDRLAKINQTLGHPFGDDVLRAVTVRLLPVIRASDTLSRIGSHQFALIATQLRREEDSIRIAQHLLTTITQPITVRSQELFLSASIGIAVFPHDGDDVSVLVASADEAMHECRRLGGNGWHLHRSSVSERALQRLELEMELHRAVERGELFLRYQPVFDVLHQQITAVEALVRWKHPSRGELLPSSFLEVAEETGLIVPIGEQLLDQACAQARDWRADGWKNPSIAINLSSRQFDDPALLERIDRAASKHGVPSSVLQVEITEGTALRDMQKSIRTLSELRFLGVPIAIDDFGIGYSSLAYLKQLPLDVLKIDRTFLTDIPAGRDVPIVAAVIAMGHALGLTVVAEGVERVDQMSFLREYKCDLAQGYLLCRPTTAAEISQMRADH
jgi:diguanylate cyclase (GGDEF)-like protein/PAS domain S-box-containing protein